MDTEALKQFGLSEKEIKVYLANLELGDATANNIAVRAEVSRPTTYDTLTSLKKRGLVGHVIRKNISYFEAANPKEILSILKEREEKIRDILPDLLALKKSVKEKPKIELYEGDKGLKNIINDLIYTKEPILTFSSNEDLMKKLTYAFPNYIQRRIEAKIPIKVIAERNKETEKYIPNKKETYREIRFVPKEFEFPNAMYIYGDKIAMLDLNKDPSIGIIIKDESLNKMFRAIFNLIWKNASK